MRAIEIIGCVGGMIACAYAVIGTLLSIQ